MEQKLNINSTEEAQEVHYTDGVMVNFSPYGVVFTFMQLAPAPGQARVTTRVGMSIEHAKALKDILIRDLEKFGKSFDKDSESASSQGISSGTRPFGFGG